jgi:hypothetical protein
VRTTGHWPVRFDAYHRSSLVLREGLEKNSSALIAARAGQLLSFSRISRSVSRSFAANPVGFLLRHYNAFCNPALSVLFPSCLESNMKADGLVKTNNWVGQMCPTQLFVYKDWLGDKDLNLDSRSQSPLSCR